MRDRDVLVLDPATSTGMLTWAGVRAADLDPCTHRPKGYRQEWSRRTFEDPQPCAKCAEQDTLPQLLDTGPASGLRWLPLCGACTDAHLAHLSAIVDRMYGPSR